MEITPETAKGRSSAPCLHDRYRWSNTLNEGICIDCMARLTERPTPLLDKEEPVSEENVYIQIARKIIAIPDNKPERAADHKLKETAEIIERAMRMAERNAPSQAQRLQARNLVFENNKPVADHVNETFEGLNSLTDDTEVVWWYKELIVQTVLHFTLQERQKAIDEVIMCIEELCPSAIYEMFRKEMYHHIEKLKQK